MNLVVGVRCHYCSRFRSPREMLTLGTGGAKMCWRCFEWHRCALRMLAGYPPSGCQQCGVTFQALRERNGGGDIRMYLMPKDGIYQVLCKRCSDRYLPKRVDLIGDTAFGRSLKLAA